MSLAGTLPPAVILAAGESSRFWPLSTHGHKALHRLGDQSVIEHTIESLAAAGIRDLIIVQSPIARAARFPHRTIQDQLGDGERYGVAIRYLNQPEADGPGPALQLALTAVDDWFFVVYPESVNAGEILTELWAAKGEAAAVEAAHREEETWLFGVYAHQDGQMTELVEKPSAGAEPSDLCRTGLSLFGPEYAAVLRREPVHEFSNIFALQKLCQARPVRIVETGQPFFPLKYPWHLFAIADYLRPRGISPRGRGAVTEGATIDDRTIIGADAVIAEGVTVRNCLIGAGSRISSDVADSIIGAAVTIESDVTVLEAPLDGGHVQVDVKGHLISTGLSSLGTVIGQNSVIKQGAQLNPGVLIGANARVAKNTTVEGNISDEATVSRFEMSRDRPSVEKL